MKYFEKYLMPVSFVLAFAGIAGLLPDVISVILCVSVLAYLVMIVKELRSTRNTSHVLNAAILYLTAQTLVTLIFGIRDYPLKETFSYITGGTLIITLILLIVYRREVESNYADNSFLTRITVCTMFSFLPLW